MNGTADNRKTPLICYKISLSAHQQMLSSVFTPFSTMLTVCLSHSIGNCVNNPTTAYAGAHKFCLKKEEFKTIKFTNDLTFI
jgi:hypothetical protein